MKEKINTYLNKSFSSYEINDEVADIKNDLLLDLEQWYDDLISNRKDSKTAYSICIESIGDLDELLSSVTNKKYKIN